MTVQTNISDRELIDFVYVEVAGKIISENVVDFSDYKKWQQVVNGLDNPVGLVYRISILNRQVMNGGLIQYFDNGYGIFAQETLKDLNIINANLTFDILKRCLTIINPNEYQDERFVRFIEDHEYNIDYETIDDKLDKLDNEYYDLDSMENLELLVGTYLRQHSSEIK